MFEKNILREVVNDCLHSVALPMRLVARVDFLEVDEIECLHLLNRGCSYWLKSAGFSYFALLQVTT